MNLVLNITCVNSIKVKNRKRSVKPINDVSSRIKLLLVKKSPVKKQVKTDSVLVTRKKGLRVKEFPLYKKLNAVHFK